MNNMKTCTKCGETKPLSEFGKHKQMKDGLSYWCKDCSNKRTKAYRGTPSGIYTSLKGRTKFRRKNTKRYRTYHDLIISRKDFIEWHENEPKVCVYCDLPEELLNKFFDSYNYIANRLTVDCKDNELGYSVGNLVLACKRCNSIKSDLFSFEEMREIGQKFIKPKWVEKIQGRTNDG